MRGEGRIFRRRRSSFWWCEYYLHGEEFRESTKETDEKRALKYLKRRLKEVGADQIGAKRFVGHGPNGSKLPVRLLILRLASRTTAIASPVLWSVTCCSVARRRSPAVTAN